MQNVTFEIVLKNLGSGAVSRVDKDNRGDRDLMRRIADMRNAREGRDGRLVRWMIREAA
jgi:hypothetical protein